MPAISSKPIDSNPMTRISSPSLLTEIYSRTPFFCGPILSRVNAPSTEIFQSFHVDSALLCKLDYPLIVGIQNADAVYLCDRHNLPVESQNIAQADRVISKNLRQFE